MRPRGHHRPRQHHRAGLAGRADSQLGGQHVIEFAIEGAAGRRRWRERSAGGAGGDGRAPGRRRRLHAASPNRRVALPALIALVSGRRRRGRRGSRPAHATLEDVFVTLTGPAPARWLNRMTTIATAPSGPVQLTLMRLRELSREPGTLFWMFGFPVLIAVALGLAFRNTGPEPVAVGVLPGRAGRGHGRAGRRRRAGQTARRGGGAQRLRAGRVAVVLVPPAPARATPSVYRYDPMRPERGSAARSVDDVLQRAAGRRDALRGARRDRARAGRAVHRLPDPGLIGMNLMSGSMWGTAGSLVNMRVRKLLKRLVAAPMRRRPPVLGQAIARLIMIPVELGVILIFARLAFDVRMAGSWLALVLVSVTGQRRSRAWRSWSRAAPRTARR